MLYILKSYMRANQAAKLANQLVLLTITFLHPINHFKEKSYAHHPINMMIRKAIKQ